MAAFLGHTELGDVVPCEAAGCGVFSHAPFAARFTILPPERLTL